MILLADYDSGSKISLPNPELNWKTILADDDYISLTKENGLLIPFLIKALIRESFKTDQIPLLIGGDHSLSFFSIMPLLEKYKSIKIIHFDAHHDSYSGLLSNYSVFHHLKNHYNVKVIGVGYRYESEFVNSLLDEDEYGNIYISVDFDYFDPSLIKNVNFPVNCVNNFFCDYDTFYDTILKLKGNIIGADFVEWKGSDDLYETNLVKKVFALIKNKFHDK